MIVIFKDFASCVYTEMYIQPKNLHLRAPKNTAVPLYLTHTAQKMKYTPLVKW